MAVEKHYILIIIWIEDLKGIQVSGYAYKAD